MNLVDLLHADQQPITGRPNRAWIVCVAIPLALLLLSAVVAIIGLTISRNPIEGNAEATFARAMAAHHAQAVEMALIIRDRTADLELRQFALDIILTQQSQIGQMDGWLAVWGLPLSSPTAVDHRAMPGMATQQDVNALRTQSIPEMEVAFLRMMVVHHQGGVQMAQDVLRQTNRPEVTRLAQAIVAAQQNEIDYMQSLLAARDATPAQPAPTMPAMEHGGG